MLIIVLLIKSYFHANVPLSFAFVVKKTMADESAFGLAFLMIYFRIQDTIEVNYVVKLFI